MELDKNQHSVYYINYHFVMVVKYRRKVISDEILGYLRATFERIGVLYGVELKEWNHDKDHVHALFKFNPQIAPIVGVSIDVIKKYTERAKIMVLKAFKLRL